LAGNGGEEAGTRAIPGLRSVIRKKLERTNHWEKEKKEEGGEIHRMKRMAMSKFHSELKDYPVKGEITRGRASPKTLLRKSYKKKKGGGKHRCSGKPPQAPVNGAMLGSCIRGPRKRGMAKFGKGGKKIYLTQKKYVTGREMRRASEPRPSGGRGGGVVKKASQKDPASALSIAARLHRNGKAGGLRSEESIKEGKAAFVEVRKPTKLGEEPKSCAAPTEKGILGDEKDGKEILQSTVGGVA